MTLIGTVIGTVIVAGITFGIVATAVCVGERFRYRRLLDERDATIARLNASLLDVDAALVDAHSTISTLSDSNTKLTRVVKGRATVWATFSEN